MEWTLSQVILFIILLVAAILLIWFLSRQKQDKPRAAAAGRAKADDLKLIEGIGPKIFTVLKKAGITSYDDLAKAKAKDIRKILDNAGITTLADPGTWPEQAQLAAAGKMKELEKLKDELKGGRRV